MENYTNRADNTIQLSNQLSIVMRENRDLKKKLQDSSSLALAQKTYIVACDRRLNYLQDEVKELTSTLGERATPLISIEKKIVKHRSGDSAEKKKMFKKAFR